MKTISKKSSILSSQTNKIYQQDELYNYIKENELIFKEAKKLNPRYYKIYSDNEIYDVMKENSYLIEKYKLNDVW